MANFYVDIATGNDTFAGTSAQPWASITYAVSAASPVSAGDTVFVRAGTYVGRVHVNAKSGTIANPIRLIAEAGIDTVFISGGNYVQPFGTATGESGIDCVVTNTNDNPLTNTNGAPAGQFKGYDFVYSGLLHFNGVSHWIFEDVNIIESRGRGVVNENSTNCVCTNITIDGCRQAGWWTNSDDCILEDSRVYDAANFFPYSRSSACSNWPVIINMIRANNTIVRRNEIARSWGEGIATGRESTNCFIENNTVHDCFALLIYAHFSRTCFITGNLLTWSNSNKYNRGGYPPTLFVINMEARDFDSEPANDFNIYNNVMHQRDGYCFAVWNNQGGNAQSGDILFVNNTCINEGEVQFTGRGHAFYSITNGNTHNFTRIKKSIFLRLDGGAAFDGTNITNAGIDFDYNCWSTAPPAGNMTGANIVIGTPTFIGLPSTPATEFIVNSIDDYKQTFASITRDAGGVLGESPTVDAYGVTRPQ